MHTHTLPKALHVLPVFILLLTLPVIFMPGGVGELGKTSP